MCDSFDGGEYSHILFRSADVIHPAPGAEGRPSFTALVANVDSDTAKYIADCQVQTSRQELIEDLGLMSEVSPPSVRLRQARPSDCLCLQRMLRMYMQYRQMVEKKPNPAPKRIIFYRGKRHINVLHAPLASDAFVRPTDGVSEGQFKQVLDFGEFATRCEIDTRLTRDIVHRTA